MQLTSYSRVTSACIIMLAAAASQAADIGTVGMMYAGGEVRTVNGFEQHVDHALVHYFLPKLEDGEEAGAPVVMYPGLGLTSYIYISTPDNREGWAQYFTRKGHPVYVYDPVSTGPSGLAVGATTSVTTWNIDQIWRRWGLGESRDKPYEDVRFPIEAVDQFYASWAARVGRGAGAAAALGGDGEPAAGGQEGANARGRGIGAGAAAGGDGAQAAGGRGANAGGRRGAGAGAGDGSSPDAMALAELLETIGEPAILMPHSFGYGAVNSVAASQPELVAGTIVIETTGCPTQETLPHYRDKPFLAVYGDYIESRGQTGRYNNCKAAVEMINEAGGDGAFLDLPAMGIKGNTHLLMQDDNSDDIAEMVTAWIAERF